MGSRPVCPPQLLEATSWSEGFIPLFPVMVLMAKEASVLSLATLGRLAIVAFLAGLDTRDQDVCCFLAGQRASVTRLAIDAHVSIVTEYRIGQPHRSDV